MYEIRRLGTPLLLGGLLRYFRKNSVETYENALWYAAGICIVSGVNGISYNQIIYGAYHVGANVRVAVCSVVYRKVGYEVILFVWRNIWICWKKYICLEMKKYNGIWKKKKFQSLLLIISQTSTLAFTYVMYKVALNVFESHFIS